MLFNSWIFWIFFAIVLVLAHVLPHRGQNRMLLVASCIFYAWWDWRFLSLIAISTLVDYLAAIGISSTGNTKRRKIFCLISVCVNLSILGIFKYYGFFAAQLTQLFNVSGLHVSQPSLNIILPLGISFYTFQTMSYTIDVFKGKMQVERNLFDFALYVSFFPQLVAGPIERSSRLLPQIKQPRHCNGHDFATGLYLIITGLFMKIVVADNMAPIVNTIFSSVSELRGADCWMGTYAFAFQIYGDFAGYSAIACGTAKWLGFDLMTNFQTPYFATSPDNFWRRWHISLSTWLRDYLYIPLGGNRKGRFATCRNLVLTMLLGGLWHGANWTFAVWGLYHGILLIVTRPFRNKNSSGLLLRFLRVILTFHLVCIGWVIFRSPTMAGAITMLRLMATDLHATPLSVYGISLIAFFAGPMLFLEAWSAYKNDSARLLSTHWLPRVIVYSYFTLMIMLFQPETSNAFLYFRF
ncbi:MAG: MBOAT family protein [Lentisphaerae bacterium]|nr:MBOAT family protein [Lentisphaerota bacterium]